MHRMKKFMPLYLNLRGMHLQLNVLNLFFKN